MGAVAVWTEGLVREERREGFRMDVPRVSFVMGLAVTGMGVRRKGRRTVVSFMLIVSP
jgi:hypothetical protein